MWTREAVLLLIELYQQFEGKMKSVKHKKKMLWSEMAQHIKDNTGLAFTGAQVCYIVQYLGALLTLTWILRTHFFKVFELNYH